MNYVKKILGAGFLFFFCGSLSAQTNNNYLLAQNYSLTIHGGSNVHDWTEAVRKVNGTGSVTWNTNGSFDLNNLKLVIETNSITSSEGFVMTNKTHKYLNATKYPLITFILHTAAKSIPADGREHEINASGMLTIAGLTQPVILHAMVRAASHGMISFKGSQPIKMSDYHIDPPTAFFGALKVANGVTLQFKTTFIANNG